jgi:MFS transporter, VNT family, synaptic vesicle glycoprotein 2
MIWFPELFNRYEEFEHRFPNTSASVCDVSGIVVADEASEDPFDCLKTIDQSVYMHTLIVGLACIPTSLWLPLCVHKLGAKFFLSKYTDIIFIIPSLSAVLVIAKYVW